MKLRPTSLFLIALAEESTNAGCLNLYSHVRGGFLPLYPGSPWLSEGLWSLRVVGLRGAGGIIWLHAHSLCPTQRDWACWLSSTHLEHCYLVLGPGRALCEVVWQRERERWRNYTERNETLFWSQDSHKRVERCPNNSNWEFYQDRLQKSQEGQGALKEVIKFPLGFGDLKFWPWTREWMWGWKIISSSRSYVSWRSPDHLRRPPFPTWQLLWSSPSVQPQGRVSDTAQVGEREEGQSRFPHLLPSSRWGDQRCPQSVSGCQALSSHPGRPGWEPMPVVWDRAGTNPETRGGSCRGSLTTWLH